MISTRGFLRILGRSSLAPRVDGNDFDEGVSANLGQVQPGTPHLFTLLLLCSKHLDRVALQSFFNNINNTVNLLDTNHGEAFQILGTLLALRDTTSNHNFSVGVQTTLDLILKMLLSSILNCAAVKQPKI